MIAGSNEGSVRCDEEDEEDELCSCCCRLACSIAASCSSMIFLRIASIFATIQGANLQDWVDIRLRLRCNRKVRVLTESLRSPKELSKWDVTAVNARRRQLDTKSMIDPFWLSPAQRDFDVTEQKS